MGIEETISQADSTEKCLEQRNVFTPGLSDKELLIENIANTLSDRICENLNHKWIDILNSDENSGENNRGKAERGKEVI